MTLIVRWLYFQGDQTVKVDCTVRQLIVPSVTLQENYSTVQLYELSSISFFILCGHYNDCMYSDQCFCIP